MRNLFSIGLSLAIADNNQDKLSLILSYASDHKLILHINLETIFGLVEKKQTVFM